MKKTIFFAGLLLFMLFPCFIIHAQGLEEGVYTITSALNSSSLMDLSGGSAKNGRNIQIYEENQTASQQWIIKKRNDGYYTIASVVNDSYVLDVSGGNFKNNSNVQLYKSNNTNAQKWRIVEDSEGYYTIASYNGNYVLDVSFGKYYNGTNMQIYKSNGTKSQKFMINKYMEGEKTIEDGIYKITNSEFNYALDLDGGELSRGAKIQIYSNNNSVNQRWEIIYLENGYYSIKPYLSMNFSLDVKNASKLKKANLQLYDYNASDAQQWIIKENQDGTYKIVSKRNGHAIEVENGKYQDYSNVYLNNASTSNAQKWQMEKIENYGYQTIEDGYYFIRSKLDNNKMLDIYSGSIVEDRNVQLYESNATIAQKWHVKYIGDGYYQVLANKNENFALTISSLDKRNIQINSFQDLDIQKWVIKDVGNGYYSILSKDRMAIDVAGGNSSNGTNVGLYTSNNTDAQKFKFTPTAEGSSEKPIENGFYFIESALGEDRIVDLRSGNISNGNNIQLYERNNTKAQKWYLTYIENGYYKITSGLDSTKAIDVSGGSIEEGTNVQLYQYNNTLSQQWVIKDAGDGYFYLVSNANGLYLDVDNAAIWNGTNIEVNRFTGNSSQKFKFIKTRLENLVIDVSEHQKDVDWVQVKNYGIYGVILRIGYLNIEDTKFAEYISKIKELKIPYGIYLFSYATDMGDVNKEATFVKNMIAKYDLNPTLGIYYDLEEWGPTFDGYYSAMNTPDEYDQFITSFVKQVESSYSNYEVKVYTSTNYANEHFGDIGRSHVGWIAEWNSVCNYNGYYKVWQYSSKGRIPGINTAVDLNYYYLD